MSHAKRDTQATPANAQVCKIHGDYIVDCSWYGIHCPTCKRDNE